MTGSEEGVISTLIIYFDTLAVVKATANRRAETINRRIRGHP